MKILICSLAITLMAGTAFAQSVKGKSFVGANSDLGMAYPAGTISSEMSQSTTFAYGLTARFGYGIIDSGMIVAGLGYEYRPIPLKYNDTHDGKGDFVFKQSFVVIDTAWRFIFSSPVYLDLGAFYGIKTGYGKYKMSGDTSNEGKITHWDKSSKEINPYGLIFGFGYLVKASEHTQFDFGVKVKHELANQYEDSAWKLRSDNVSFTIGVNYFIK
jgi:hypothetical protein